MPTSIRRLRLQNAFLASCRAASPGYANGAFFRKMPIRSARLLAAWPSPFRILERSTAAFDRANDAIVDRMRWLSKVWTLSAIPKAPTYRYHVKDL